MARDGGERAGGCGDLETKGRKFFKISHVQCCSGLKDRDIQHRLLDSATRRPLGTFRTISLKCGGQKPDWNGLEREQKERK